MKSRYPYSLARIRVIIYSIMDTVYSGRIWSQYMEKLKNEIE